MGGSALSAFLVVNPATRHSTSRFALLYAAALAAVGIGVLLLRKWAAATFLCFSCIALIYIGIQWFRPDSEGWVIALNTAFVALPAWACFAAWRQLKP
jgi:4-hydroxybenzoate polyprenyltransferase